MSPSARGQLVQLGRSKRRRAALVGNPNTGKSTVFNALTGLRQKTANYPGVTVDLRFGTVPLDSSWVELIDLPGMYSLAAHSPDELLALDVLLGKGPPESAPDAIVVLVDATNLERNLFLVSQLMELELPLVVALTMVDLAEAQALDVDTRALANRLGVPVVPVVAKTGRGLEALGEAIDEVLDGARPRPQDVLLGVRQRVLELLPKVDDSNDPSCEGAASVVEMTRALIDRGALQERLIEADPSLAERLDQARVELGRDQNLVELEAEARYAWAAEVVSEVVESKVDRESPWTHRIDRALAHPLFGTLLFIGLMALAFQAVFSWATPVMESIDGATGALGDLVRSQLPEGAVASLLADGVIAGVGAVVIFLPQIIILFLFILILEDSGYMARAAFMMDRLMRACGLSGQSFIPMLSSFACAVPGILAARVIPNRRDRLATILAAPFMTCSARLPVYALLIAAFVPQSKILGLLNLQGLVLLGLYFLGVVGGVATALILKRTLLRGPTPAFVIEMPPYRLPSWRSVVLRLWERVKTFLVRAGTIIFAVSIVVWALAYFPRSAVVGEEHDSLRAQARETLAGPALGERLAEIDHFESAQYLERSALGRLGKIVEPVFMPLGWDWRVSAGVIASLPAREVVLAALGTIYAVGSEVDENDEGLRQRFRAAEWPDGRRVFSLPMALGLMVFFALCLQCGATVAAIRRESGSWFWPIFAWCYMSFLAYFGALLTYRVGSFLAG